MKNHITKNTVLSLLAAALVAVPGLAYAQDANSNAPAAPAQTVAPGHQKRGLIPFRGKLGAVDPTAMTLTVGNRTFVVTAGTKILKNGEPATLSDGVVGEPVRGAYKKAEGGKFEAVTVHFGAKSAEKPKPENSNGN
jgi:hypothetical protein